MKRFTLVFLVPEIAILAGCRFGTFTDAEGNKTTLTQDGDAAAITVEGADGSEAQMTFGGSGVFLSADKGEARNVYVSVGSVEEGGTFITVTTDMAAN
ncbi:MAG: hypothetical protein AAFQ89_23855 [Cyanobacteria bacterium J06626_18]